MSIENTNRWRQCTLKIDNPVEIFVRTPIQPIEQQAACRWEGTDDDDDDHMMTWLWWWWWLPYQLCDAVMMMTAFEIFVRVRLRRTEQQAAPLSHRQIELMSHYGRLQSHFQNWQIHLTLKIIVPKTTHTNQPFSKCGKSYETPSFFSRSETTDITDITFHFHISLSMILGSKSYGWF